MNHGYPDPYERLNACGPWRSDARWRSDRAIPPETQRSIWAQYGWTRESGWPNGEALRRFLKRT